MKAQVRVQGYVVGYDKVGHELLWTVKVRDPKSAHDGKKFAVTSCHFGTMLTRPSVDVTFRVEPVRVGPELDLRAVDVALASEMGVRENPKDSAGYLGKVYLAVTKLNGEMHLWTTGAETEAEVREFIGEDSEEELLAHTPLDFNAIDDKSEVADGIEVLQSLTSITATRDALELVLNQVFRLAQTLKEE
ncbi:hypothetical protein GF376_04015 [Candidatus Peregrinibacteria bacterium]|nr:hypothetical protein [Candidatus Peregrinibacteria bacterium]